MFHYLVYFLPACSLVLIALAGEWESNATRAEQLGMYAITAGLALPWLLRPILPDIIALKSVWLWLIVGIATGMAAASRPRGAVLATLGVCVMSFAVSNSFGGHYNIRRRGAEDKAALEWDVFRGALFLQKVVGANVPTDRPIGFWYANTASVKELDSVQSMYLWGYSRLAPFGTDRGMPYIDDAIKTAIMNDSVVALLGVSEDELDRGVAALASANIPHHEFMRTAFKGKTWGYSIALVDIGAAPPSAVVSSAVVPMAILTTSQHSRVNSSPDGLQFATEKCQGCSSLFFALPKDRQTGDKAMVLRVHLEVQEGRLGLNVADANATGKPLIEKLAIPRKDIQVVELPIPRGAGQFIISNHSPRGPSRGLIRSLELIELDDVVGSTTLVNGAKQ